MQDKKLPVVGPMPQRKQPPDNQIQANSSPPAIQQDPPSVIKRNVHIRTVKDIEEYDYPQAVKTWQALEEAGLEPGDMVANALEQGHGYESNQISVAQPFKDKQKQPLSESIIEESRMVSYRYVSDEKLLASAADTTNQNAIVTISQSLTVPEDTKKEKAVKIVAVIRKGLPKLLK